MSVFEWAATESRTNVVLCRLVERQPLFAWLHWNTGVGMDLVHAGLKCIVVVFASAMLALVGLALSVFSGLVDRAVPIALMPLLRPDQGDEHALALNYVSSTPSGSKSVSTSKRESASSVPSTPSSQDRAPKMCIKSNDLNLKYFSQQRSSWRALRHLRRKATTFQDMIMPASLFWHPTTVVQLSCARTTPSRREQDVKCATRATNSENVCRTVKNLFLPRKQSSVPPPQKRTDPYAAPYFFPTPGSPHAVDYVRQVQLARRNPQAASQAQRSPRSTSPEREAASAPATSRRALRNANEAAEQPAEQSASRRRSWQFSPPRLALSPVPTRTKEAADAETHPHTAHLLQRLAPKRKKSSSQPPHSRAPLNVALAETVDEKSADRRLASTSEVVSSAADSNSGGVPAPRKGLWRSLHRR
ncbi:predicted protein [Postia placenta Mad-698-R]|nr:predicted protein [Postia placenta Mad-698-R]